MEPNFVGLCSGTFLCASAIFLNGRSNYGAIPTLIAIGIGIMFGFSIGFVLAFMETWRGCDTIDCAWEAMKMEYRFVMQNNGVLMPLCAFGGMLVSCVSLWAFGRRLRKEKEKQNH